VPDQTKIISPDLLASFIRFTTKAKEKKKTKQKKYVGT